MANTYLKRSLGTATSHKKGTWSFWVKKSKNGASMMLVGNEVANDNNRGYIQFNSSDKLRIIDNDNGGDNCQMITAQVFRDVNAWYHFVFAFDTTQSTASDRIKWYVNGEQITTFDTASYPAQNIDLKIFEGGEANKYHIGSLYASGSGSNFFDGCMSHVHFSDGYSYAPTVFGSTDSVTGEWQINTAPSFTLGNNGFTILKDGNTITDQSSNSNDFTLGGGTLSKSEDNPSNVFATLNPLDNKFSTDAVFSNGNNYVAAGGAGNGRFYSTLGMVSGKYYCEIKNVSGSGGTPLFAVAGTSNYALSSAGSPLSSQLYDYALYNGNVYNNDATVGGSWGTVSDGNIIGIAINLDNEQGGLNKLYFSINGVWQNGADPSNFTSATGVVGITKPENMSPGNPGYGVGAYFFACGDDNSYAERRFATNFGNGYFQTTAVSSAGTNASGNRNI